MDANTALRWRRLINDADLKVTKLSTDIGCSRGYLSQLFAAAEAAPSKLPTPSITTVMNLARELGLSVEELMNEGASIHASPPRGYSHELHEQSSKVIGDIMSLVQNIMISRGIRPSVEDVISWWRSTSGRLTECGQLEEAFDLIEVPKEGQRTVRPYRVGAQSLASEVFGENTKVKLTSLVDQMSEGDRLHLVDSYRNAGNQKVPVFSEPLNISIDTPGLSSPMNVEYIRLQLPIEAPNGTPFVINYSFPIMPVVRRQSSLNDESRIQQSRKARHK